MGKKVVDYRLGFSADFYLSEEEEDIPFTISGSKPLSPEQFEGMKIGRLEGRIAHESRARRHEEFVGSFVEPAPFHPVELDLVGDRLAGRAVDVGALERDLADAERERDELKVRLSSGQAVSLGETQLDLDRANRMVESARRRLDAARGSRF